MTYDEALAEIKRLRYGIQVMIDGKHPNPWQYRSLPSKACPHETHFDHECQMCNEEFLTKLLADGSAA